MSDLLLDWIRGKEVHRISELEQLVVLDSDLFRERLIARIIVLNDLDLPRRADWSPEGEFVECSIVPQLKVRILNLDWIDDFPILFAVDVVKQVGYCVMDDVVVLLDRYDAFVVAELDLNR